MKKSKKIALFTAITFIILGCLFSVSALFAVDFDFTKLDTSDYTTKSYMIEESFTNISIDIDTADLYFLPSEDNTGKVVCKESEKISYNIFVADDTLNINVIDKRVWHDFIGFGFDSTKMTVYLPEATYNDLFIESRTGDICMPNNFSFDTASIICSTADIDFRAQVNTDLSIKLSTGDVSLSDSNTANINIEVSTGDVNIKNITCENISTRSSTGEMKLNKIIASGFIKIKTTTGDVKLSDSDADTLDIKTSTGDVWCSLLSGKIFTTKTSTGDVSVPQNTADGGVCRITTSTGDIKVVVKTGG